MKYAGNSIILRLSSTPPSTVDLPASSGGTPLKINIASKLLAVVSIYVAADFYITVAADDSAAAARLGSNATRGKLPAGFYSFEVAGLNLSIYIISQGGGVPNGVSYIYSDFS